MLIRIVKLSFEEEKISEFLSTFNAHKEQIKNFKGCTHLELLRDKNKSNIFFRVFNLSFESFIFFRLIYYILIIEKYDQYLNSAELKPARGNGNFLFL